MVFASRTPHGVRGLKFRGEHQSLRLRSRTPHGVRGLKSFVFDEAVEVGGSHPSRGAWIEMVAGIS